MQNIMQAFIRHALQDAVAKAVEKAAVSKAEKAAREDGRNWRGNFHYLVSGYYTGLVIRYTGIPVTVFISMLAIWMKTTGDEAYIRAAGIAVFFLILILLTGKRMKMIVYWDGGIMFFDRAGNVIVQMPSTVIDQAVIKRTKIVFMWEGKNYKISVSPQDNESAVQEMLAFYEERHNRSVIR